MRKRKIKSAEKLRGQLRSWCEAHGGREISPPSECGILMGTWRVPLFRGALIVHMPSDDAHGYHIHTRFAEDATPPADANQYSGKWNHYGDNAAELFERFTRCAARHVLPRCALAMGCLCAGHARGNGADAACDTREGA